MDPRLAQLSADTGAWLKTRGWRLATAESCTGGWVAEVVTATAGSSDWFDCGWVSYSNTAKQRLLGVPAELIAAHGAVSEPVVIAMAQGALERSAADVAIAISGIAGPGGGTPTKPVGTVCFAWAWRNADGAHRVSTRHFDGDREAVRLQAVQTALQGLLELDAPVLA